MEYPKCRTGNTGLWRNTNGGRYPDRRELGRVVMKEGLKGF